MGRPKRPCVILVAGGAGAGKTCLSRGLVRRVPNAVLLDKDRLLGAWVDRLLSAAGAAVDRDSAYYWERVRPEEYATLERIAYDHLELGKVAIIDAPLRPELDDAAWMKRVRGECEVRGSFLLAVWVRVSPETARRRMEARAEPRDLWKLTHWEEFLRRQPYDPPSEVSLVVTNEDASSPEALVGRILDAMAQ